MDVINDPEVDAVWICSPSQYHAEQIKACAANNKHVFCEKPIATDLAETVEAINACNEAGVKLMIGLQRRFDQNFVRVKQAVSNKEVGEPIMVRVLFLRADIIVIIVCLCLLVHGGVIMAQSLSASSYSIGTTLTHALSPVHRAQTQTNNLDQIDVT